MSYHFTPALTAGALRWQKLLPLLAERGWACDVLTLDPRLLENPDWERLRELPESTRVFSVRPEASLADRFDDWRVRRQHPAGTESAAAAASPPPDTRHETPESLPPDEIRWTLATDTLRRLYGTLLIHGREAAWARAAVKVGRALAARTTYRGVISSGPPHGSHAAGAALARRLRVPLITDFRDPWSVSRRLPEAYASPLYFALAGRGERAVLKASALVLATTEPIAASLREAGASCPVITVMNGLDDEEHRSPPRDRFIIAYAGALYLDRDPRPLFKAVASIVRSMNVTPAELEVRLIGPVEQYAGRSTRSLAAEAGIEEYVNIQASIPRRELAERLAQASVLVSFPQDSKFAVPSKLFEYMAFEAWLLILSPPDTPSAMLMAGTGAVVVPPGARETERIGNELGKWLTAFRAGARPSFLPERGRFGRRAQADILIDALERFRGADHSR